MTATKPASARQHVRSRDHPHSDYRRPARPRLQGLDRSHPHRPMVGSQRFHHHDPQMDVRPGGEWRFVMHGPDGRDYKNRIIYNEIVKPERLTYTHIGDDVQ